MEVTAPHRVYADELLALALELSTDKYGPYIIERQSQQTVIRRQLVELEKGTSISVAISMPTPEWLEKAIPVRFPLMRGLSSYRLFLGNEINQPIFKNIKSLNDLKSLSIGQGPGWSTGKILEDNGFKVVYGGPYPTLIPMLEANRFQLLMRGIFEVRSELKAYKETMPTLIIVNNFAVYTYLPMYYFVAKNQPELAQRIEFGLKRAFANGQLEKLFKGHFKDDLKFLDNKKLNVFYIPNTNIDQSFFQHDKPYLLKSIIEEERKYKASK
ncbi:MAG TPA: hypothetical protein VL995_06085 [Cellvibrio sp.]|nr:hypothetical protein [Cellvibrio sp.]